MNDKINLRKLLDKLQTEMISNKIKKSTSKKKLISTIIIVLISYSTFSQKATETIINELDKKIESIENRVDVIEMHKSNLNDKFQNKSESLDIKVDEINSKLQKDYNYIEILVLSFGSIAILGLLTLFISIYRYIHKVAKGKIDEKFDSLFNNEKDKLTQLIDSQILENSLRKNKKILVLTETNDNDSYIRRFFLKMDFKKVTYVSTNTYQNVSADIDLVFINNELEGLSDQIIENYINDSQGKLIFHFGAKRINMNWVSENKIAIANNRVQLYGNLINALKYIEML